MVRTKGDGGAARTVASKVGPASLGVPEFTLWHRRLGRPWGAVGAPPQPAGPSPGPVGRAQVGGVLGQGLASSEFSEPSRAQNHQNIELS